MTITPEQQHLAEKPLVLVDGSSYLYRAFHALPPLTNSHGEATGAVYGVINMIRKLLNDYQPEYVAIVFDAKGKTFRDDIFAEYKMHRPPMPDELKSQIAPLHAIIKAMGLPLLIVDGVEADDVIGTLAIQAKSAGMSTLISTGDKDMTQLVNEKITLINTMSNTLLDRAGVKNKFGVNPEQMIDYLMLVGDSSDNIPGVPNVGPKTAAKWLQQFNTLDDLITNAANISGKAGENLRLCLEQFPLARQLVTIKTDVSLPITIADLKPKTPDHITLIDLFRNLEFKTWLAELLDSAATQTAEKKNYHTILTEEDFLQWLTRLQQADTFAFDTETTDLDYMSAQLVGFSFALEAGEAMYIPLIHEPLLAPQQLDKSWVLEKLRPLLADTQKTIIGQNLKYDLNVLANYQIPVKAQLIDTMLESYVLSPSSTRHDMESLALKYLGKKLISFEEIAGKGIKQLRFNQIPLEPATQYAAEDADITLQLHQTLWPKITAIEKSQEIFSQIEMPTMQVISRMERNGVLIDAEKLHALSCEFGLRMQELEQQAYTLAETTFNLGSPKQLQEILYDKLKLPILKKTPTGQASTAENVLQELAHDYPLPKTILEYRSLSKLKSTYTDRLPQVVSAKTNRVHTSYNQAVTATGRLSSTEPNLQNIPIRHENGRRIRQAFIAPKNYKIISADYSQIELRLMAHLSQDVGLLNAFAQNLDIHTATAAEVFNTPLADVSSEQRRRAKAINFGLIYGMSAFGLGQQLGIERGLAQEYIDIYFTRYPGIKNYMEKTRRLAHVQGYVETVFGRRLYLAEINSKNLQRQKAAERAAINAPLQGTAADIIKLAMIQADQCIQQSDLDIKMIMQVHDELVFEVAENNIEQAKTLIQDCMTHAAKLSVPLVVSIGVGDNWDEAH